MVPSPRDGRGRLRARFLEGVSDDGQVRYDAPRQATRGASSGRRVIVTAIMGAITNVAEAQLMRADPDVFQLYFVTALVDLVPAGVYVVITKAVAAAMTDQPLRQTAIQLAERPLLEIARRRATR